MSKIKKIMKMTNKEYTKKILQDSEKLVKNSA